MTHLCETCGKDVGMNAPQCWRCNLREFSLRVAVGEPLKFRPCHGGCGRGARDGSFVCGAVECAQKLRQQERAQ